MSLATFYGQYDLAVGHPADFCTSQWQDASAISWWYVTFSCFSALYLNVEIIVKVSETDGQRPILSIYRMQLFAM